MESAGEVSYRNVTQVVSVPVMICEVCKAEELPKVRNAEFRTYYETEGADLMATGYQHPEGWEEIRVPGAVVGMVCPSCATAVGLYVTLWLQDPEPGKR